jgi:hypothetical protein
MTGHTDLIHFSQSAPNNVAKHINTPDAHLSYFCPHCEERVHGAVVAATNDYNVLWLSCTNCGRGAVRNGQTLAPSSLAGASVEGLPEDVKDSYEEARRDVSIGSYTSAELMCRKILMHIAVDKGAEPNKYFAHYLTHLENSGYVTPPMKDWVDQIRKNANEATHELPAVNKARALSTLSFTTQLLRSVYEVEFKYQQSQAL